MNDDLERKASLGIIFIIGLAIVLGIVGFAYALFSLLH